MNKEYAILPDNSVEVIDEEGKKEYRNFDDNYYLNEILMNENKLEMINHEIEEINKVLIEKNGLVGLAQNMIKTQPLVVAFTTLIVFVGGGLTSMENFISYGIYYGLDALIISSIIATLIAIAHKIVKEITKKKIIGLEGSLKEALKLKKQYEKELEEMKQKSFKALNITYEFNKVISLDKQNDLAQSKIKSDLDVAYENAISDRKNKLVLTRKK